MTIDMHAHTTRHQLRDLHTNTATLSDLEQEAKRFQVSKIVLMATYFPLKGTGLHNQTLLDRIKEKPLFLAFGSLDVQNDFTDGLNELDKLARESRIGGIKLYPGYQDFDPSDKKVFDIYSLAQNWNLPVVFHAGELHGCCSRKLREKGKFACRKDFCQLEKLQYLAHPYRFSQAIYRFPKVKFVISHLANPYFEELRNLMFFARNVFTDISGQFVSESDEDNEGYREEISMEIRKFLTLPEGKSRVMFATDYPIQSYKGTFDLVTRLGLSNGDLELLLAKNAENVLDPRKEVN